MDEYSLSKSRGKKRSDKFHNTTKKIHVPIYSEFYGPVKDTHYGAYLEREKFKKEFPNYCYECLNKFCYHMIMTRVSMIWRGKLSSESPFFQIPKPVLHIIWRFCLHNDISDTVSIQSEYYRRIVSHYSREGMGVPIPGRRNKKKDGIRKDFIDYKNCD